MKNAIITGGTSKLSKTILSSSKIKKITFFSQFNKGKKIYKKNINYIKSDFLNSNSIRNFCKKLNNQKIVYDAIIHTPSGKLELKRFFEYNWPQVQKQINIQVKSLFNIINFLTKNNKIGDNFKIIIISSYITQKKKYPKGFTSYFLAKILLEGYAQILSKELKRDKIKIYIIRPKFFKSSLHSTLPSFYLEKNMKKEKNELNKTTKKIINLILKK